MMISVGDISLHVQEDGDPNGAPIVFANSLGTDLRLWDKVVPLLPEGLRIIRFDKRGHGQSDVPDAPYSMGQLITDTERLLDALEVRDAVFVGLSIGGMIAQGLAVKRLDMLRAIVLSNTAFKFGTAEMWQDRIAAIRAGGIDPQADGIMERWFSRKFRDGPEIGYWSASRSKAIWVVAPRLRARISTRRPLACAFPRLGLQALKMGPRRPIWCATLSN
jgi:3-oxoadipate enol-lactonase